MRSEHFNVDGTPADAGELVRSAGYAAVASVEHETQHHHTDPEVGADGKEAYVARTDVMPLVLLTEDAATPPS